jgi:DNA replication protein DnaC
MTKQITEFLLEEAGVPKRYWNARLSDFKVDTLSFTKGAHFICGPVGSGKTHLMAAVLREKLEKVLYGFTYDNKELAKQILCQDRCRCRFTTILNMLSEIKATFRNEKVTEQMIINKYTKDLDYLFIDDLGIEMVTDWSYTVIYQIIDKIYGDMAVNLFIVSNYPLSHLKEKLDERITSRIEEMCQITIMGKRDK